MLFVTGFIAYLVVEAALWFFIFDASDPGAFGRSMDAPIVERWRRQHRRIVAVLFVLAVAWLVYVLVAAA